MKHLLLSLALIISANAWADMDKVCLISADYKDETWVIQEHIKEKCERNNILNIVGTMSNTRFNYAEKDEEPILGTIPYDYFVTYYCRFDRNVNDMEDGDFRTISCVLYDNEPRISIPDVQEKR